jgi:hypothetical protein
VTLALRTVVLLLAALAAFAITAPARAAAPNFIVVRGSQLPEPILLDDWNENLELLLASENEGADVDPSTLSTRPYFDVVLLWGPTWTRVKIETQGADEVVDPGRSDRFYPAVGDQEPVIAIRLAERLGPREAGPTTLAILARNGVPTRLEESHRVTAAFGSPSEWWPLPWWRGQQLSGSGSARAIVQGLFKPAAALRQAFLASLARDCRPDAASYRRAAGRRSTAGLRSAARPGRQAV